jgi:glycosyltransferase involved in cell wall biosynthesis
MRVLISAPSLDVRKNVSGVSAAVLQIRRVLKNKVEFFHLEIGSEQGQTQYATYARSLRKALQGLVKVLAGHYDILHANTALNSPSIVRDLVMIAAARLRGKQVLLHFHGGKYMETHPPTMLRAAISILIALSKQIVVLGERERLNITRSYKRSIEHIAIVRNGIDIDRGVQDEDRLAGFHTIFAGRLADSKGLQAILEACPDLPPGMTLTIYGQGPWQDEVEALTARNVQVKYGGIFAFQDARKIMSRFHALVLPSTYGEGMPMVVLEAMSVGTVPICTPLASIPEIVQNGHTGIFIDSGPKAISAAIADLRDAPGLWPRMSAAAKAYAAVHFDANENYLPLLGLYQRLLDS